MTKKTCTDCLIPTDIDLFYHHSGHADGRDNQCMECVKKRQKVARDAIKPVYVKRTQIMTLGPHGTAIDKIYRQAKRLRGAGRNTCAGQVGTVWNSW